MAPGTPGRAMHDGGPGAPSEPAQAPPHSVHARIVHALLHEAESREAAVARELHDGVGSSLAALTLLLGAAESFTREPEALALLRKALEQVTEIMQQVRQISRGIMPTGQESGALLPAL